MATFATQFDHHAAAYGGVIAGLSFTAFEITASAYAGAPGTATTPLRMIGATVLGREALAPSYPLLPVAAIGCAIVMVLSVLFSSLFAAAVRRIRAFTGDEFLDAAVQRVCAGLVFGTALWLLIFYAVAPLVGWSWFPADVHAEVALGAYALFFGVPVGWLSVHRGANGNPAPRRREAPRGHFPFVTASSRGPSLPIENALARVVAALAVAMVVAFCIWLVVIYVGVEYVRPPWDSSSVPPERTY